MMGAFSFTFAALLGIHSIIIVLSMSTTPWPTWCININHHHRHQDMVMFAFALSPSKNINSHINSHSHSLIHNRNLMPRAAAISISMTNRFSQNNYNNYNEFDNYSEFDVDDDVRGGSWQPDRGGSPSFDYYDNNQPPSVRDQFRIPRRQQQQQQYSTSTSTPNNNDNDKLYRPPQKQNTSWNKFDDEQRAYRESKFNRKPEWPQGQYKYNAGFGRRQLRLERNGTNRNENGSTSSSSGSSLNRFEVDKQGVNVNNSRNSNDRQQQQQQQMRQQQNDEIIEDGSSRSRFGDEKRANINNEDSEDFRIGSSSLSRQRSGRRAAAAAGDTISVESESRQQNSYAYELENNNQYQWQQSTSSQGEIRSNSNTNRNRNDGRRGLYGNQIGFEEPTRQQNLSAYSGKEIDFDDYEFDDDYFDQQQQSRGVDYNNNMPRQWQQPSHSQASKDSSSSSSSSAPMPPSMPPPPPMLTTATTRQQQGVDIGTRYTKNFRRGTKSGGYNYRKDFAGGSNSATQQQQQQQQQGPTGRSRESFDSRSSYIPASSTVSSQDEYETDYDRDDDDNERDDRRQLYLEDFEQEARFGIDSDDFDVDVDDDRVLDSPQQPLPPSLNQQSRESWQQQSQRGDFGRSSPGGANHQYYNDARSPPPPKQQPQPQPQPQRRSFQQQQQQQQQPKTEEDFGSFGYKGSFDIEEQLEKNIERQQQQSPPLRQQSRGNNNGQQLLQNEGDFGRFASGANYQYYNDPRRPPIQQQREMQKNEKRRQQQQQRQDDVGRSSPGGANYQYYNDSRKQERGGAKTPQQSRNSYANNKSLNEENEQPQKYRVGNTIDWREPSQKYETSSNDFDDRNPQQQKSTSFDPNKSQGNNFNTPTSSEQRPTINIGEGAYQQQWQQRNDLEQNRSEPNNFNTPRGQQRPTIDIGQASTRSSTQVYESMEESMQQPEPHYGARDEWREQNNSSGQGGIQSSDDQLQQDGREDRFDQEFQPRKKQKTTFDFGSLPRSNNRNESSKVEQGFGYGGLKKMLNRLTSPYSSYAGDGKDGQVNINMSRVNTEITKSMSEEQRMITSLLANARECLLADPSVQNLLGDAISLGKPFSKVASSTMVNDITRSRLQLGIPIEGSFGSGRIRLVANQDEIEILELDVEGRVIDVRLDKDRRSDGFVDVDVVNREMY